MYSKIVHIVTDHQYRNTTEIQRRATPETSEGHIMSISGMWAKISTSNTEHSSSFYENMYCNYVTE